MIQKGAKARSLMRTAPAFAWKLRRDGTRMARSWTAEPRGDKLVIALLETDQRIGWHDDLQRQMCSADAVRQKLAGLHDLRAQIASSR